MLQIYPYLVVNDACLTESRREERVLQLLRMLNHYLGKQKVCLLLYNIVMQLTFWENHCEIKDKEGLC